MLQVIRSDYRIGGDGFARLCRSIVGIFLVCLIAGGLDPFIQTEALSGEKTPSPKPILEETLHLTGTSPTRKNVDALAAIAIRQARVESCEKAKKLFKVVRDYSIETWTNAAKGLDPKLKRIPELAFLTHLAREQRRVGCIAEMKHTSDGVILLYKKGSHEAFEQLADKADAEAFFRLNLELHIGFLYWGIGEYESVNSLLKSTDSVIQTAQWSPGPEFKMAAVLLARMGHDDEARQILNRYEKFYDDRVGRENNVDAYNRHWMYRIDNWAWLADAQAKAGHRAAARDTLKRALEKARSLPIAHLNEVYGIRTDGMGDGTALQSAGFMAIVWVAAEMGETAIALEAYNAASPISRGGGALGILIAALAKKGDMDTAMNLLNQRQCRSVAIAQGLLEKEDWEGAIRADEARHCRPKEPSCYESECDFDHWILPMRPEFAAEIDIMKPTRLDFYASLGKARAYVHGLSSALTWAREQPEKDKIAALLGIVDALVEKEQRTKGGEKGVRSLK